MKTEKERLSYIDFVKGLGIILMVVGHSGAPKTVIQLIYGFHMPLFFIVSGFLVNEEKWQALEFKSFAKNKATSLLLPYFKYALINFFLYIPILYLTGEFQGTLEFIKELGLTVVWTVYGYTTAGKTGWGPLWYLPCFFISSLLFFVFLRTVKKTNRRIAIAIILFGIERFLVQFKSIPLPWHADVAFLGMLFMYAGYEIKKRRLLENGQFDTFFVATIAALGISVIMKNGNCLDLNNNRMGINASAGFAGAVLVVFPLLWFAYRKNVKCELIEKFGRNGILVMAFNKCFNNASLVWRKIPLLNRFECNWFTVSLITLVMFVGLFMIKDRIAEKKIAVQ